MRASLGAGALAALLLSCAAPVKEKVQQAVDLATTTVNNYQEARTAKRELADTTKWDNRSAVDLQIKDNIKIRKIAGIDSLLCQHVAGTQGVIYFDEPLWENLSQDQRQALTECLDLKRQIQVRALPEGARGLMVWTARLSEDRKTLRIGAVKSNCITCELKEGLVEYVLTPKDSVLVPKRITEYEMWR